MFATSKFDRYEPFDQMKALSNHQSSLNSDIEISNCFSWAETE